ncbi:hypothetical protein DFH09DRAFT_1140611 [Mycena vulgaris]|nr:hypothetical protein DFH09DRAFT_1140611 [Mycena vulgaris]
MLVDLPNDVVYNVLSKMHLTDAWSMASVSRTFRDLSKDRSFWMIALRASPSIRSPSNQDDLPATELQALKQLARHFIKLERNWTLPNPRILGEVRKWDVGIHSVLETNHLFQFPGSELFIFHSGKLLKCFNFGTGEFTTVLDMNGYVRSASYDFLPDRSVLLGIALRGGSRVNIPMLLFAKTKLDPDKTRVVATIILQPTVAWESDCHKPFVSSQIVGAVQSCASRTEILAYDLASGGRTVIETDLPMNYITSRRLDFSFYRGNLYLIADDGPRAVLYCCPRDSLPYGSESATTSALTFGDLTPISFPTKVWKRRVPVCSQMLRNANFMKVHDSLDSPHSQFVTVFRFWTSSNLDATPPCEVTLSGMCSGEQSLQIGPTGHNVVASLLDMGHPHPRLCLVRFHPDLDSCSSHELELPQCFGAGPPPNVLSVDDHRGVVWLVKGGDLLSIPYA